MDKPVTVEAPAKPESATKSQAASVDAVNKKSPEPVKPIEIAIPEKPEVIEIKQEVKAEPKSAPQPVTTASRKPASDKTQPSAGESAPPGWTCGAKGNDDQWDCKLVGADPNGQAKLVNNEDRRFSLLEPAFDYRQEQTFTTLTSKLKHDPWENCTVQLETDSRFIPGKDIRASSPLDVKSDYSEIFDNEIGSYYGNVEMNRADQHSSSHIANYDAVSETLDLQGGVYYSEDELALYSETATLKLGSDQAKLRDTLFISPSTPIRGRARVVYRDNKVLSRYKNVAYTSCKPGNQDWVMHASELKINKSTGKGAAKNAWLEAKGVPVFYFPYVSFPTDNRRLSGFLAPSYHYTQTGGLSVAAPYYWNIAPNYDATFNPRYFAKRGMLLGGNFRYLFEKTKGNIAFEFLPHDSVRNQARYLGSIKNNTRLTPYLSSNVDLNYVSDKNYFSELGNALSFNNFSFIRSSADVDYVRQGVSLIGRFDYYQSVDPTINGLRLPYTKLPQVNLNLNHSFKFMPLDTAFESEYVQFQHNNLIDGQRVNAKPSISFPLQTASAFLTPKMSWQYTRYDLNNRRLPAYGPTIPPMSEPPARLPEACPFFLLTVACFWNAMSICLKPL